MPRRPIAKNARSSQGHNPTDSDTADSVHLPVRVILYSLDQIAVFLAVTEAHLKTKYMFYEGRSLGKAPRALLLARNIAPEGTRPDWRVTETEFVRWMRYKGFKFYRTGSLSH